MARFRKLTPAQRACLVALKALGSFIITGADGKPVKALKRRGLARIKRIDGARHAVLRENKVQQRARRRLERCGLYVSAAHAAHFKGE